MEEGGSEARGPRTHPHLSRRTRILRRPSNRLFIEDLAGSVPTRQTSVEHAHHQVSNKQCSGHARVQAPPRIGRRLLPHDHLVLMPAEGGRPFLASHIPFLYTEAGTSKEWSDEDSRKSAVCGLSAC